MISADTLPVDLGKVPPIIARTVLAIQKDGVPAELFDRIRQTTSRDVEDDSRTNRYWLGNVLASLQQYPDRVVDGRNLTKDYAAVTRAEPQQLALRYFDGTTSHSFVALPPANR